MHLLITFFCFVRGVFSDWSLENVRLREQSTDCLESLMDFCGLGPFDLTNYIAHAQCVEKNKEALDCGTEPILYSLTYKASANDTQAITIHPGLQNPPAQEFSLPTLISFNINHIASEKWVGFYVEQHLYLDPATCDISKLMGGFCMNPVKEDCFNRISNVIVLDVDLKDENNDPTVEFLTRRVYIRAWSVPRFDRNGELIDRFPVENPGHLSLGIYHVSREKPCIPAHQGDNRMMVTLRSNEVSRLV